MASLAGVGCGGWFHGYTLDWRGVAKNAVVADPVHHIQGDRCGREFSMYLPLACAAHVYEEVTHNG